jgi:antitoxin (DNA-binding transcriptional repressor) of toxin-antitoxin stability system
VPGKGSITIKQLHAKTGEHVRRAGQSRTPVPVTDRGKLVAVLVAPYLLPAKRRRRTLLPEYAKFLANARSSDVLKDLDAVRADR